MGLLAGCSSDDGDSNTPVVSPAEAYTAIVRWEAEQRAPVVDEDGNVELPVVYLTAAVGGTIDIAVQADVVGATADDDLVVRFSDEADEAIDDGVEGSPVRDDGTMFVLEELPEGDANLIASVRRYRSIDEQATLHLEIVASDEGAKVISATEQEEPNG